MYTRNWLLVASFLAIVDTNMMYNQAIGVEKISHSKLISQDPSESPGYLHSIQDPAFGSTITRVTDPGKSVPSTSVTWAKIARHRYSSSGVWNADQSLMMLGVGIRGDLFLAGANYHPLFQLSPQPGSCEWHPTDPPRVICVDARAVVLMDVRTGATTKVFTADGYGDFEFGPGKGNPSLDGRYIAIRAKNDLDRLVAFVVDIVAGVKFPVIDLSSLMGNNSYVSVSPTGRYLFVYQNTLDGDQGHVFTREGQPVQSWTEHHRPGHGDMTVDIDGEDVYVGISKSDPDKHHVIKRRLSDGTITDLTPGRRVLAQHASARNVRRPGWVLVTFGGTQARAAGASVYPFYQEVAALRIDGSGQMVRVAHTRSVASGYRSEAHGSPSPDLSKVIFASNWGDEDGSIAAYVAELPGKLPPTSPAALVPAQTGATSRWAPPSPRPPPNDPEDGRDAAPDQGHREEIVP